MCVIMKTSKSKKEARLFARKIVNNLTPLDKEKRADEIINLLKENKEFQAAEKVGIYYPLKHEINLLILKDLYPKKKFYFPRTKNKEMDFCEVTNLDELVLGKFNLLEPKKDKEVTVNIDVYLVPCIATTDNYRIGHGAGFYDLYFKREKGYKIGIVFKELKNLNIEINHYDIPMDIIL